MKTKYLIGILLLLSLFLISGCGDKIEEAEQLGLECEKDDDCNEYWGVRNWRVCIENKCISYKKDCSNIAKIDYNLLFPTCYYTREKLCDCDGYMTISPEQRIEKNNSIQIIGAEEELVDISFEMK